MPHVAEPHPECRRALRRSHQSAELVTDSARRNVFSIRLCVWPMAPKTVSVRIDSARDRERNTSISRTMTTVTSGATMLGVIEFAVETSQRRERLHRATLSVCMTDRANWTTTATRKEWLMTTNTRCVLIFPG